MDLELSPTAQHVHGPLGGSILLLDCAKEFYKTLREDHAVRIWFAYLIAFISIFAVTDWFPRIHENNLKCTDLIPANGLLTESLVDVSKYNNSTEALKYTWDISTWFKIETRLYDPEDDLRYRIKIRNRKVDHTDKLCDAINADAGANFTNISPNMLCIDPLFQGQGLTTPSANQVEFKIYKPAFPEISIVGNFKYERYFFPYDGSRLEFYVQNHTFRFTASRSISFLSRINFEYGYLIPDQDHTGQGNKSAPVSLGWPGTVSGLSRFVCGPSFSAEPIGVNETVDQEEVELYSAFASNETMRNLSSIEAAALLQDVLLSNDMHAIILFISFTYIRTYGANGLQFALLMLVLFVSVLLYCILPQWGCFQRRPAASGEEGESFEELQSMVLRIHNIVEQLQQERGQNSNEDLNEETLPRKESDERPNSREELDTQEDSEENSSSNQTEQQDVHVRSAM